MFKETEGIYKYITGTLLRTAIVVSYIQTAICLYLSKAISLLLCYSENFSCLDHELYRYLQILKFEIKCSDGISRKLLTSWIIK
jgi:hypothetical protein